MESLSFLALFLGWTLLGVFAGALTGLSPGLHVNNLAALIVASQASWAGAIALFAPAIAEDPGLVAGFLSCFLVAATVSHSVFDFIPSTFLGAASEETALSILPGHRMLLRGEGALAVALAARGALLGTLVSTALLLPLRLLLSSPIRLAEAFRPWTPWFLLGLLAALLASEASGRGGRRRRIIRAAWTQILAGALGIAVLRGPSGLDSSVALFPLFSGLFGLPGLILAARARASPIPPQRVESLGPLGRQEIGPVLRGALSGAAVSWLPGLSGGAAATLASIRARRRSEPAAYMVVLGSVSTSTAVLSVAVLFIIGRARSGSAAAVRGLLGTTPAWTDVWSMPMTLLLFLASAVLAVCMAAPLASRLARILVVRWPTIDGRRLAAITLVVLGALLLAVAGLSGILVAGIAAAVGTVPIRAGVRRVHLMTSLLLPVLLGSL